MLSLNEYKFRQLIYNKVFYQNWIVKVLQLVRLNARIIYVNN